MKKILSILLIISTLVLSLGIQSCFAENQIENKSNSISQNIEKDKDNKTLQAINDLKKQIQNLEIELKKEFKKQEQNSKKSKSIFNRLISFADSALLFFFSYCLLYGSTLTFLNWSKEVKPLVELPAKYSPDNYSFLSTIKRFLGFSSTNTTRKINLLKKGCQKTVNSNLLPKNYNCDRFDTLNDPADKFIFFSFLDAPCALYTTTVSLFNYLKSFFVTQK